MNRYAYTDAKRAHRPTLDNKPLLGTSTVCGIIGGAVAICVGIRYGAISNDMKL